MPLGQFPEMISHIIQAVSYLKVRQDGVLWNHVGEMKKLSLYVVDTHVKVLLRCVFLSIYLP